MRRRGADPHVKVSWGWTKVTVRSPGSVELVNGTQHSPRPLRRYGQSSWMEDGCGMGFSEGWEWLEDLPESWDPPMELKAPTSIPMHNLVISMISSGIIGNVHIRLLGGLTSEYAEFNLWVPIEGKRLLSARQLLECSSALEEMVRRVYEAWDSYRGQYEAEGARANSASMESRRLLGVLESSIAELAELRRIE
jgi:hypothetical protein